jgi:SAM-dependent methyltransferase
MGSKTPRSAHERADEDARRHRLRATFEEVPELYDAARPLYPRRVFDDLVELANLEAGSRVLEIGPGTGLATLPLAERGLRVVGVELGERLAVAARRKLAEFPNVEIVTAPFEVWEPASGGGFHAVVAFTAFHWIDPDARYAKTAQLLQEGGALAVVSTKHVLAPGGDAFWSEVQEDYDAVVPSEQNRPPPRPEEVADLRDEIDASGRFRTVAVRRYLWDVSYDARTYLELLDTASGHRAMPEAKRQALYTRIRERMGNRKVSKTLQAILNVARRL